MRKMSLRRNSSFENAFILSQLETNNELIFEQFFITDFIQDFIKENVNNNFSILEN